MVSKYMESNLGYSNEISPNTTGALESMRHLKNEVDSIKKDVECGLRFKDTKVNPQAGDIVVCYSTRTEPQKTDWDPGF